MPSDRIDTALSAVYARSESDAQRTAREQHCQDLEQQLADLHAARPLVPRRSSFWRALLGVRRLAVASVVFAALAIGACQVPVEMELVMGHQMRFVLPATDDIHRQIESLTGEIQAFAPVEKIEVQIHKSSEDDRMVVQLGVWGEGVEPEQVFAHLRARLPILEEAQCDALPLAGTVRTTLGDRLGHDLFHLALDQKNVEQARAAVLEELAASGFDGDAQVTVEEDDGHRRIEIRLHQQEVLPNGDTADQVLEEEIEKEYKIHR